MHKRCIKDCILYAFWHILFAFNKNPKGTKYYLLFAFCWNKRQTKGSLLWKKKKTKFSLSSMHKRWSKTAIWKNEKVKQSIERSYVVSRNKKNQPFWPCRDAQQPKPWMQHVNPDKLLYNLCDQILSFEFKMKTKGIKNPRKDDLLFHKRLTFSHDR